MKHTIGIGSKEISFNGHSDFNSGILNIPNSEGIKVSRALAPSVEGQNEKHEVTLDGKRLPDSFLLRIRAPKKPSPEG